MTSNLQPLGDGTYRVTTPPPVVTRREGHLFRFAATSQGSDDDWGLELEPYTIEVRAWSMVEALRKALALTEEKGVFVAWTVPYEGED